MYRILRALKHKRFWCWLSGICWFLGHDPNGGTVPKSLVQHGRYVACFHYYCRRCQSAEPPYEPGSLGNDWWRGNIIQRTVCRAISLRISRALNRNEFFPEKTDTAFMALVRVVWKWYSKKEFERWQRKYLTKLKIRRSAWDKTS